MPYIVKGFTQEKLIPAVDLVKLIQQYVPLKKSGANWTACCPFHNEKTPSFFVSPSRNMFNCFGCGEHGNALDFIMKYKNIDFVEAVCPFHNEKTPSFFVSPSRNMFNCFGCGEHGNALDFIMKYKNIDFVEAVEELAHYAGIEVEYEKSNGNFVKAASDKNKKLYELMDRAAHFFTKQLELNPAAKDYFINQRGLSEELIVKARLGFAPDSWDYVEKVLIRSPEEYQLCVDLGLQTDRFEEGKHVKRSFFRGRVMFPIFDKKGRIIAFGGRVFNHDFGPKYLNSPESPIFRKRTELFGLYETLQAHRNRPEKIVVVEGYMDAIALRQAGFDYVVATLGTAITQVHLKTLFRFTDKVICCFDGDEAGKAATWRAIKAITPVIDDPKKEIRFINLPAGHDPDTLIRAEGKQAFEKEIQMSVSYSECILLHESILMDVSEPSSRIKFINSILSIVKAMKSPPLQIVTLQMLADYVGMTLSTVQDMFNNDAIEANNEFMQADNGEDYVAPSASSSRDSYVTKGRTNLPKWANKGSSPSSKMVSFTKHNSNYQAQHDYIDEPLNNSYVTKGRTNLPKWANKGSSPSSKMVSFTKHNSNYQAQHDYIDEPLNTNNPRYNNANALPPSYGQGSPMGHQAGAMSPEGAMPPGVFPPGGANMFPPYEQDFQGPGPVQGPGQGVGFGIAQGMGQGMNQSFGQGTTPGMPHSMGPGMASNPGFDPQLWPNGVNGGAVDNISQGNTPWGTPDYSQDRNYTQGRQLSPQEINQEAVRLSIARNQNSPAGEYMSLGPNGAPLNAGNQMRTQEFTGEYFEGGRGPQGNLMYNQNSPAGEYMSLGPNGAPLNAGNQMRTQEFTGEYFEGGRGPQGNLMYQSEVGQQYEDRGAQLAAPNQVDLYEMNGPSFTLSRQERLEYKSVVGLNFTGADLDSESYRLISFILQYPTIVANYYNVFIIDEMLALAKELRIVEYPCLQRLLTLIKSKPTITCAGIVEEYRGTDFEPLFSLLMNIDVIQSQSSSPDAGELNAQSKAEYLANYIFYTLSEPFKNRIDYLHQAMYSGSELSDKMLEEIRALKKVVNMISAQSLAKNINVNPK